MLSSLRLQRSPGAVILLLLTVCVSYSNQLSGLSFQPVSNSERNTPQQVYYNSNEQEFVETRVENERRKRDIHTEASHPNITTHVTLIKESHNSLIVYWAGKDVIICLGKDVNANSVSTFHISRNYGATFDNATPLLRKDMPDGVKPVLDKFFNHPTNNGKFIFTDVTNHLIFTTDDYGTKFRRTSVSFVPDEILFVPYAEETIFAYEKNTAEKRMWISKDFGASWTMAQDFVKSVSWDESSHPAKLYIHREEPGEKSVVLTSVSSFVEHGDVEVKFAEVEEFEIKDEYMFATKKGMNVSSELYLLGV
ncbi:unnamed protein product [Allacma fusca]|uniref:Sortilin N-terminal domain-containing protein n=1 Tax=Allacma fusca TaxID=39272 RepID=A0A8J2K0Z3_9HEXA|nr:unnamed protein product [Allacma fusca]